MPNESEFDIENCLNRQMETTRMGGRLRLETRTTYTFKIRYLKKKTNLRSLV